MQKLQPKKSIWVTLRVRQVLQIDCSNLGKLRLDALSWPHHALEASEPVQQIKTKNCITDTTKWEKS